MLVDDNQRGSHESHASWDSSPDEGIRQSAVGSFHKMTASVQNEIHTALAVFYVSDNHRIAKNVPAVSCFEICDMIGYDYEMHLDRKFRWKISADFSKDVLKRTLRRYKTGFGNSPAKLNW
jgi:hypothetical protein